MRVFLVDDHEVVRRGVAELLEEAEELTVVGQAATAREALARIPAAMPDVAVLDVRLPDGNGIELCRELRSSMPELHCLMLTSYPEQQAMADAVMAGAAGYVVKDIIGIDLVSAVIRVGHGESLMDARAKAALLWHLRDQSPTVDDPTAGLSDQEKIVLELIGDGLTNRQIAERMFLAEKTVKNYVSRLLAKLGMERRTQAAVLSANLRHQAGRAPR
ncbi:response regulator transcription factor [Nakamurella sp. A5-74]|uniref:Response regulator transcription factor n=1 Tax=Nakamurella sp. A5-74 TaxID=3158264 RepID=A0AAU8DXW6_9ACTN